MLESAERRLLIVKHAIDRYTAGEDLRGHPARALDVGSAHESVEAEARVVRDPDRIFLGFVGDDTQDGAENLFLGDRHVVRHIDKHRGLHEVTRLESGWMALTPDEHFRPFDDAFADV